MVRSSILKVESLDTKTIVQKSWIIKSIIKLKEDFWRNGPMTFLFGPPHYLT
jgi:hypothetical protein